MRFTVDRAELQKALTRVARVSPGRTPVNILTYLLFSLEKDRLYLRASDLELTVTTSIEANIEESGVVALPTRTIQELVHEIPTETITFHSDEENRTTLETSLGNYQIMGLSGEDFPSLPAIDIQQTVRFSNAVLRRMIEKTIIAVSEEEAKPALRGILFNIEADRVVSAATDGHRLIECIRYDFKSDEPLGGKIIPPKFLNFLLHELGEEGETELVLDKNHAMVEINSTRAFTRLIHDTFPEYHSVLPEELPRSMKANRNYLDSVIKRVSILSNRNNMQVLFYLDENESYITTEDVEKSSVAREKLEIDYKGEPLIIGYNAIFLREMLKNVDTGEFLMQFTNQIGPALIFPSEQQDNEKLTMLIMPIRLAEVQ